MKLITDENIEGAPNCLNRTNDGYIFSGKIGFPKSNKTDMTKGPCPLSFFRALDLALNRALVWMGWEDA
jgi:hypothetical protein